MENDNEFEALQSLPAEEGDDTAAYEAGSCTWTCPWTSSSN